MLLLTFENLAKMKVTGDVSCCTTLFDVVLVFHGSIMFRLILNYIFELFWFLVLCLIFGVTEVGFCGVELALLFLSLPSFDFLLSTMLTSCYQLHQYEIIGRKVPTVKDPKPNLLKMTIFAPNTVVAKSRFWYFISQLQKLKKANGEIVDFKEVYYNPYYYQMLLKNWIFIRLYLRCTYFRLVFYKS